MAYLVSLVSDTDEIKIFPNEFKPWKESHYYPKIPLSDQGINLSLLPGESG